MKFRLGIAIVMMAMAVFSTSGAAGAGERYGQQKVVYHINGDGGPEGKLYKAALTNVQNHVNAVGRDNIEVKIVLHGDGLKLLMQAQDDVTLQSAVTSLKTQNVSFLVCNNTLTGRHIDFESELFEVFDDDIVPSGVAELSHLQQQGYTYIKP